MLPGDIKELVILEIVHNCAAYAMMRMMPWNKQDRAMDLGSFASVRLQTLCGLKLQMRAELRPLV